MKCDRVSLIKPLTSGDILLHVSIPESDTSNVRYNVLLSNLYCQLVLIFKAYITMVIN